MEPRCIYTIRSLQSVASAARRLSIAVNEQRQGNRFILNTELNWSFSLPIVVMYCVLVIDNGCMLMRQEREQLSETG